MPTKVPQAINHSQPSLPPHFSDGEGSRSKYRSNIQKESRDRKINNGSLIAAAWTWNISPLVTNKAARTTPAVREGVIRQPRTPSSAAFRPNNNALTQRTACNGSMPNNPKNARTAGKEGGKCVTGWSEASQASR